MHWIVQELKPQTYDSEHKTLTSRPNTFIKSGLPSIKHNIFIYRSIYIFSPTYFLKSVFLMTAEEVSLVFIPVFFFYFCQIIDVLINIRVSINVLLRFHKTFLWTFSNRLEASIQAAVAHHVQCNNFKDSIKIDTNILCRINSHKHPRNQISQVSSNQSRLS